MSITIPKGSSLSKNLILDIVQKIEPLDDIEQQHKLDTISWIKSDAPIFRVSKPDVPNKHLVAYFILYDPIQKKVLLVDHKKAKLWLPTGGHVEIDEDPRDTVIRECFEELKITADFLIYDPIFVTSTETVGLTAGHTDVSLWYALRGDANKIYDFDKDEFNTIKWFSLGKIPFQKTDPHMERFIDKLSNSSL